MSITPIGTPPSPDLSGEAHKNATDVSKETPAATPQEPPAAPTETATASANLAAYLFLPLNLKETTENQAQELLAQGRHNEAIDLLEKAKTTQKPTKEHYQLLARAYVIKSVIEDYSVAEQIEAAFQANRNFTSAIEFAKQTGGDNLLEEEFNRLGDWYQHVAPALHGLIHQENKERPIPLPELVKIVEELRTHVSAAVSSKEKEYREHVVVGKEEFLVVGGKNRRAEVIQLLPHVKMLGSGGSGRVYKVYNVTRKIFQAMKLGVGKVDAWSINREAEIHHKMPARKEGMQPAPTHVFSVIRNPSSSVLSKEYTGPTELTIALTELYAKGNLAENLRDLTDKQALVICKELLQTFQFLRENGICHGDLKPSNIFVDMTPEGNYKITLGDWGAAHFDADTDIGKVIEGAYMSSLDYEARWSALREQHLTLSVRTRIAQDMFGFGVTLYKILTRGREPYRDMEKTPQVNESGYKIFPRDIPQYYRKPIERLVMSMLEIDPSFRAKPNAAFFKHAFEILDDAIANA